MSEIAAALRDILPARVALAEAMIPQNNMPQTLWPGESLPGAIAARLAEFAAGRSAARQALQALGLAPAAIPMGPDRAPIWPDGATGSISHCAGSCLAVMGFARDYRGLGLDVEPLQPLPQNLWPIVLRPEEHSEILTLPAMRQGVQALRIFVAKEAAYKAQYSITRQIFDFQTLRIIIKNQEFIAVFQRDIPPIEKYFHITGRLAENHTHTAAMCWLATG